MQTIHSGQCKKNVYRNISTWDLILKLSTRLVQPWKWIVIWNFGSQAVLLFVFGSTKKAKSNRRILLDRRVASEGCAGDADRSCLRRAARGDDDARPPRAGALFLVIPFLFWPWRWYEASKFLFFGWKFWTFSWKQFWICWWPQFVDRYRGCSFDLVCWLHVLVLGRWVTVFGWSFDVVCW